jgi:hypothetical protein
MRMSPSLTAKLFGNHTFTIFSIFSTELHNVRLNPPTFNPNYANLRLLFVASLLLIVAFGAAMSPRMSQARQSRARAAGTKQRKFDFVPGRSSSLHALF